MIAQFLIIAYGFLFLGYVVAVAFILFHLFRYSFNKSLASLTALTFLGVSVVLILTNASLFFAIPWNTIFLSIGIHI